MSAVLQISGLTKAYKPGAPVLKGIALTDGLHNMARFENDVIFQDGE